MLIRGGRIIDPAVGADRVGDLAVEEGRIRPALPEERCDRVIDAAGLIVAPGLVDIHVHFRDPGYTHKEDLHTGAAAAARGGFTTVVCMANTDPVLDDMDKLRGFRERSAGEVVRIHTVAAVSRGFDGKSLTDMRALLEGGAVAFSDDGIPLTNAGFLRKAMELVAELGAVISLHEEDPDLIGRAGVNDGSLSRELGFTGAPRVSESSMIARDCLLALDTGARVHFQHVSCRESVAVIRWAKEQGAHVTAEVTPQHFSLTEAAVRERGSLAKLNPPLRGEEDVAALIEGLGDGTIDAIATDHAPHAAEEKALPLLKAPSGMTGLETALALGITHLVGPGKLSLPALLEKMTCAPAAICGLSAGTLETGAPADLVLFDEAEIWEVRAEEFASRSANSPFIGQRLRGKVKMTICGGRIVYRDL